MRMAAQSYFYERASSDDPVMHYHAGLTLGSSQNSTQGERSTVLGISFFVAFSSRACSQ